MDTYLQPVPRPSRRQLFGALHGPVVLRSAYTGAAIGGLSATGALPVVGTIAGATIGSVVGVALGYVILPFLVRLGIDSEDPEAMRKDSSLVGGLVAFSAASFLGGLAALLGLDAAGKVMSMTAALAVVSALAGAYVAHSATGSLPQLRNFFQRSPVRFWIVMLGALALIPAGYLILT